MVCFLFIKCRTNMYIYNVTTKPCLACIVINKLYIFNSSTHGFLLNANNLTRPVIGIERVDLP